MSRRTPYYGMGGVCVVEGCDRPKVGRGLCKAHHHRWTRGGDLTTPIKAGKPRPRPSRQGLCRGPQCDRPAVAVNLCAAHHRQHKHGGVLRPIRDARRLR